MNHPAHVTLSVNWDNLETWHRNHLRAQYRQLRNNHWTRDDANLFMMGVTWAMGATINEH